VIDIDALGDWRGAGYSEKQARRLAERVAELLADCDTSTFDEALATASLEIEPDLF
jgi:hypothetical protein